MKIEIVFPTQESAEQFISFLKDADWSKIIDEDFYFQYSVEVHTDGTVSFIRNDD